MAIKDEREIKEIQIEKEVKLSVFADNMTPDRKIFSDFVFGLEGRRDCLVDTRQSLDLTRACLLTRQAADDGTIIRF